MSQIEMPKGWELTYLNDLALEGSDKFTDGPFGSRLKVSDYTESGYPIIRLQNIGIGKFINKNWRFTSEEKFTELIRHSANAGDIIIAKMADPVARATIIGSTYDKYLISADCIKIKINDEKVLGKYLVYAINSPFVKKQAEKKSKGATRLRINLSEVKKLQIPLPPLPTQKKIVQKLDYILEQFEEKKKQIIQRMDQFDSKKIHKSYENYLLTLAFNGTLTNEKSTYKQNGIQIPKDWNVVKLSNIEYFIDVRGGGTPSRDNSSYYGGTIPWVRLADMKTKYITKTNETLTEIGLKKLGNILIPKNAVILSTRATIGEVAIAGKDLCTNQGFKSIICNSEKVIPEYLYYFFKSIKQILLASSKSATYSEINKSRLLDIEIPIPPLETQKKIILLLDKKITEWDKYKLKIENIEKQYKRIKKEIDVISSAILNSAFSEKLIL